MHCASFDDAAIIDIAAAVALNTFANMVNNLANDRTDVQPDAAAHGTG